MTKNTSKKDCKLIAVFDGVFYEYHDESWHEKESWSTDGELEEDRLDVRYLYKDTNELKSISKLIITTSELPRVTPASIALFRRLPLLPFCKESEVRSN